MTSASARPARSPRAPVGKYQANSPANISHTSDGVGRAIEPRPTWAPVASNRATNVGSSESVDKKAADPLVVVAPVGTVWKYRPVAASASLAIHPTARIAARRSGVTRLAPSENEVARREPNDRKG